MERTTCGQSAYPGFVPENCETGCEDNISSNWCIDFEESGYQGPVVSGFGVRRGWGQGFGGRGGFGSFTEACPPEQWLEPPCFPQYFEHTEPPGELYDGPQEFSPEQLNWPSKQCKPWTVRGKKLKRILRGRGGYTRGIKGKPNVTLPDGLSAMGTGTNKKQAKHNAARGMLDIMDGKVGNVSQEVCQSITDGLKALRGGPEESPGSSSATSPKAFKAPMILNKKQQQEFERQKVQEQELIKQQIQYGPLGVKLWFGGGDTEGAATEETVPNRAPEEEPQICSQKEEKKREKFFVQEPVHVETVLEFMENLLLGGVFKMIDEKYVTSSPKGGQPSNPELICKMCNLVFRDKKCCDKHKETTDHLHVVKGFFPGEGGYHCFLCWLSFQQAEGLINHISRDNHVERSKKKGVTRIWMEPEANKWGKSWDLINVHKHMKDIKVNDDDMSLRRNRKRSRSRDRKRSRSRGGKRSRKDNHDDRVERKSLRENPSNELFKWKEVKGSMLKRSKSRSKDRRRSRSGGSYNKRVQTKYNDLYTESIYSKMAASYTNVLKSSGPSTENESRSHKIALSSSSEKLSSTSRQEKRRISPNRSRENFPSSSGHEKSNMSSKSSSLKLSFDNRHEKRRVPPGSLSENSPSNNRHEKRRLSPMGPRITNESLESRRHEKSLSDRGDLRMKISSIKDRKVKDKDRSPKEVRRPKEERRLKEESPKENKEHRRSSNGSDHEEVNEIQDDFEIDTVGEVENSEETLLKMKSAIIGILDEEIFSLSNKMSK